MRGLVETVGSELKVHRTLLGEEKLLQHATSLVLSHRREAVFVSLMEDGTREEEI